MLQHAPAAPAPETSVAPQCPQDSASLGADLFNADLRGEEAMGISEIVLAKHSATLMIL